MWAFNMVTGILATVLIARCFLYSHYKKIKKQKYSLKSHCISGYSALLLTILHINLKVLSFNLSESYISLLLMILTVLTGVFTGTGKMKSSVKAIHIVLSAGATGTLLMHAVRKILYLVIIG